MWGEIAQVITACAALGALTMSIINSFKIQDVHVSINSRMDQLLKSSNAAAKAEGVTQERNKLSP